MRYVLFILVYLQVSITAAQVYPILVDQLIEPANKQEQKHYIRYDVAGYEVFVIDDKDLEQFYIVDKATGKQIYEYTEQEERALHLKPKFYMADGTDNPIVICMSLEGNYSWGTHIFIIDKGQVYYPGIIRWGADNFNFSGLGYYSQFEQHDDWFIMFFQEDVKLINYETDDLLSGSNIEFKIERDKISLMQK